MQRFVHEPCELSRAKVAVRFGMEGGAPRGVGSFLMGRGTESATKNRIFCPGLSCCMPNQLVFETFRAKFVGANARRSLQEREMQ